MTLTVLFVCTGNVHRSPFGERLLAPRLPHARVISAGTRACPGAPMNSATRSVLTELGVDAEGFQSRGLSSELVDGAGLVLGFTREHRDAAVRLSPLALRRCFTLKEFLRLAGGEGEPSDVLADAATRRGIVPAVHQTEDDIADPWGVPYDELRACGREIEGLVTALATRLGGGTMAGQNWSQIQLS